MRDRLSVPWHLGHWPWRELDLFWIAAAVAILLPVLLAWKLNARKPPRTDPPSGWRAWPEARLLKLGLTLELLWEAAQFPLYNVWRQHDWGYILYGLAHCTLGDLLILLVAYEMVALWLRNRGWFTNNVVYGGVLFTLLGAGYTVFSEIMNVRIEGTWGYTDLMPRVPIVNIGATPLLQWLLIPPVLLWWMRRAADARTSA